LNFKGYKRNFYNVDGHIFIKGQIGNSYNEKGEVESKGVELIDVVDQIANLGEVENIIVHINSPGGFVSVGESIANLLGSLPNCYTIAEELCASIATKIHLSVPLQNRKIQEGTDYVIHNPFLQNVTGDASQLQDYANYVKETEQDLINMYAKATGLDKNAISGLMAIETTLTAEKCLSLKFASEIIPKEQARTVALFYTQNQIEMSKSFLERSKEAKAALLAKLGIKDESNPNPNPTPNPTREAKAMIIETDKGTIETPYMDLMVGDPVLMADGTTPENGPYVLPDGTIIEVVDGMISVITPAAPPVEDSIEALKAALEAEKAKNAELNSKLTETEKEAEAVVLEMEALANVRSNYVPPVNVQAFAKQKENTPESKADVLAKRRAELKGESK
jgi:ATP-dependent protease ClpP protease subunit